jgi:transposase InsO family protein
MSQIVFAGASVGQKGVQPDLQKLTAIVNWKIPENATALAGFLGLTGWFRDLIPGYAKKEQPLRDLLRNVELPEKYTKTIYRWIMSNFKLKDIWTDRHTKAFLDLKAEMTGEPVLRGPKWDGSPFIITTDRSQDAFGAVLTQRFEYTLPSGKVVWRLHPLGFASKRTSKTEEKYKPFLLEFAALKFRLDKFADITWGFPIEVETDCQALRDHLLNDKLSATHARWRDGILAHQIVDIRHVLGKLKVVADGLSRANEGTGNEDGDGSEWTVSEDWEANVGLTHDIFYTTEATTPEMAELRERFKDEPIFAEVIDAILELDHGTNLRAKKCARHRASEYMIEDGKLWRVAGGHSTRAKSRVECITWEEASLLAKQEHDNNWHWRRDSIKKSLLDKIWSPGLDASIVKAITNCGICKNFGPTHLHSLLSPITRRHPLELLVRDYLSLPTGKGGYHTVGLYLDTYSQHVFRYKYKTAGSAKTTTDSLSKTFLAFAPWETFMSDGGKHFDNKEVRELCDKCGTKTHVIAAYSPWINGLIEGTNKLFLHILERLCAPDLDEEEAGSITLDDLPKQWPDHFDEAIRILNWRLLPALMFSPKELMLGLVINKKPTDPNQAIIPTTKADTAL